MAKRGKPVTAEMLLRMWSEWSRNGGNCTEVARKMDVSRTTVARYARSEDWAGRLAEVQRVTAKKVIDDEAAMQARHIRIARKMQEKGERRLDTLKDEDLYCRDALECIKVGGGIEKDILRPNENVRIEVKLPAGFELP